MTILWTATVGSHMWGQNHAGSDIDLMQCYVAPSKDILRGTADTKSTFAQDKTKTPPVDLSRHEIGKVVEMLIRPNVNCYWMLFSPYTNDVRALPLSDTPFSQSTGSSYMDWLRTIVMEHPSKGLWHSTNGLANSNLRKIQSDELWHDVRWRNKKLWIVHRTIGFATHLIRDNRVTFQSGPDDGPLDPSSPPTLEQVTAALGTLRSVYADSPLPEYPEKAPFLDFLYTVRMWELGGKL